MLEKLKHFFSHELDIKTQDDPQEKIQLAAAILLIEVNQASLQESSPEQQVLKSALSQSFNLSESQLNTLIEHAASEEKNVTSLYPFVQLINQHYSEEQRVDLIRMLWKIAKAGASVNAFEEHIIRKISDLLYVSHNNFIRTKLEAKEVFEKS